MQRTMARQILVVGERLSQVLSIIVVARNDEVGNREPDENLPKCVGIDQPLVEHPCGTGPTTERSTSETSFT